MSHISAANLVIYKFEIFEMCNALIIIILQENSFPAN